MRILSSLRATTARLLPVALCSLLRVALLAVQTPDAHAFMAIGPADQPQQQLDRGELPCALITSPYDLHLTTYMQPPGQEQVGLRRYCNELPAPGSVHFTVDLLDRKMRSIPLGVRIESAGDVLLTVPQRTHPQGFIEGQVVLPAPGQYTLLLTTAQQPAKEARLPLIVSNPDRVTFPAEFYASVMGVGAIILAFYFGNRRRAA